MVKKVLIANRGEIGVRCTAPGNPSPDACLVAEIEVNVGDRAEPGVGLLVLEAMKKENELKAHVAGSVRDIFVTKGRLVEKGELLMLFT